MEADLQRFYGIDYRDRWRRDASGARLLTLRRLSVLITHLPLDSAVAAITNDNKLPWTRVEQLLDEVRRTLEATAGVKQPKPHPDRPTSGVPRDTPERRRKMQAARARQHERRRLIEAGVIP